MTDDGMDYEKQFQADLERAQALSLETLALEKFRVQKRLQQETAGGEPRQGRGRSESFKLKSRPRPGAASVSQSASMIAPPPQSQRRSSSTACPDLISFGSPPPGDGKLIDFTETRASANGRRFEAVPPLPPKPALDVLRALSKQNNSNLIDLSSGYWDGSVEGDEWKAASVLEVFDPLSARADDGDGSERSGSMYEEYDPFEYLAQRPTSAVSPPPLPPRARPPPAPSRPREGASLRRRSRGRRDKELAAFHEMILALRDRFPYDDDSTNSGLVLSPMIQNECREDMSIKVCIDHRGTSVAFTCVLSSSVEHVMLTAVCESDAPSGGRYLLKVHSLGEYLAPDTCLRDYEYVHNCIKLERDVLLSLVENEEIDRSLKRTFLDDRRARELSANDLAPEEEPPITYEALSILLDTLEREMDRAKRCGPGSGPGPGVAQAARAICTLMGSLETTEISEALGIFHAGTDEECARVRGAVLALVDAYCRTFDVDFELFDECGGEAVAELETTCISQVGEKVGVRVGTLHRPPSCWRHERYELEAQVFHGTRKSGTSRSVSSTGRSFDEELFLEDVPYCTLAREARLVLTLYGFVPAAQGSDEQNNSNVEERLIREELGWAAVQFFECDGRIRKGRLLLAMWPVEANKWLGPAPRQAPDPRRPALSLELLSPSHCVFFGEIEAVPEQNPPPDFTSLDPNTQQLLLDIVELDALSNPPPDSREILWEKRRYLRHIPAALPKVLLAAHSWDWAGLSDLRSLLASWSPPEPLQAMQLLLPCFPDGGVRAAAVSWLRLISDDELVDFLPQLVQALAYETYDSSPLASFLLERSLTCIRVAHHLYWLLLPGSKEAPPRQRPRLRLMLSALVALVGSALADELSRQKSLDLELASVAESVKRTKETLRLRTLHSGLDRVHQILTDGSARLPLSPAFRVTGVRALTSSYFPSNALPLKIDFASGDDAVTAIFKMGDDLRQDALTLQIVRVMDKLWLRRGLDLRMVTFACVPTAKDRGFIEMVPDAETLRKIQVEWGLTGSFKDKPIAEWLAKHNPSELEYERARDNFTASAAGYSVVTYILGICDRHNDNIMLKTSGHLFHIDFGKFLGDAQTFASFKRDRAPFVLTSDMAFVINGGDRPSARFHRFVDLCCQAFNAVRAHGDLLLNLFTLMASSGIAGVTPDAVAYVRNALLPGKSNPEAAATFARLIENSLKSWFTQFNFFLHNLAQLRFASDHGDEELLSFVPKRYTALQDGRIRSVSVDRYEKRYDPDKYYVYVLTLERQDQPHATSIFRTYKEFCELHQKLCMHFPLAKIHSLPTGIHMGRSNVKQVAEKRLYDVKTFVSSLFLTADEIAHSDLVYTFFHPMLRDQQNIQQIYQRPKSQSGEHAVGRIRGQLKLTLHYQRGAFSVMVHHARSLPLIAGAQEPSTYVKVYLRPDPAKSTKRKTKVIKRNCHPSFMEMLEYRMAIDIIRNRQLEATVWNHDSLQENEFLGGISLDLSQFDLSEEITEWFPLANLPR